MTIRLITVEPLLCKISLGREILIKRNEGNTVGSIGTDSCNFLQPLKEQRMQYRITAKYRDGSVCEQIITEPNDTAALNHFDELLVRQPQHSEFPNYNDWKLERMPVEAKVLF